MNYIIDGAQLTAIADAIRGKTGESSTMTVDEMPDEISGISGGGGSGATILSGTSFPSNQKGNNGDIYLVTAGSDAAGSIDIVRPQRIQVDYLMNANSTIEFDCTLPRPTNSYDTPWGSRGGADYFIAYDGGTLRYSFSDVMGNIGSISNYYNKRILITLSKTFCKVEHNGETIFNVAINGGTTTSSVYLGFFSLFTNNSGDDLDSTRASGSFHGCKIYENDVLVKNYIPFKDSQDKWCIKETIGDNLFYSVVGEPTGRLMEEGTILSSYVKVNSQWQLLIESNINDIDTHGDIQNGMPMAGITIMFYDGSTFGDAGPTTIIEEGSI